MWKKWQGEKVDFETRVKEGVSEFGKGIIRLKRNFEQRREAARKKIAVDPAYDLDVDDVIPPPACDLVDDLIKIARTTGWTDQELPEIIGKYLNDVSALLEVPYLRISSVMFAGLARAAALGEKNSPKSTVDIQFISSYLPYCDAMFIDIQSARMLRELPKETPGYLRLKEFGTKIFTLNEKELFLNYLESIVNEIPSEQVDILRDIEGDNFLEPYWSIIRDKKIELQSESEQVSSKNINQIDSIM